MSTARRRRRTLLALLVLASLLLVTLDFRQGEDGPIASAQRLVDTAFAPLQRGVAAVVEPVGGFFSSLGDLGRLRERNLALEDELRELRERQLSVADLTRENDDLRALLGMQQRLEFTTTAGRVIAQPPGQFRWTVLIDIGTAEGVRENMAVIDANGLVGKITEVSEHHARVQLAASPNAGYFVRVVDSRQHGLLSGRGSRPMQLRIIDDPEAEITPGTEVVTRAFEGTSIPDGIPVGVVDEVPAGDMGGAQLLGVAPFVDFTRLDVVLVVLDAPEVPEDLFDDDEAADEPVDDTPDDGEPDDAGDDGGGEPTEDEAGTGQSGAP
jgi:rod shape-determining protein MreC